MAQILLAIMISIGQNGYAEWLKPTGNGRAMVYFVTIVTACVGFLVGCTACYKLGRSFGYRAGYDAGFAATRYRFVKTTPEDAARQS